MRIYWGGPINGCSDEEANGWRDAAKELADARGYEWLDPMDRDYRGREMEPGIANEIVEKDKEDIQKCDVLVMNCPKPSVGTSMEIFFGKEVEGCLVLCVVPADKEPSPWLVYHSDGLYHSVEDAINAIPEYV